MLTAQEQGLIQAGLNLQHAILRLEATAVPTFRSCPKDRLDEFRNLIHQCVDGLQDAALGLELENNRFLSPDLDVALRVAKPIDAFRKAEETCDTLHMETMPEIAKLLERGRDHMRQMSIFAEIAGA